MTDVVEQDEAAGPTPRRARTALIIATVVGLACAAFVFVLATSKPSVDRQVESPLIGQISPTVSGEHVITNGTFDLDRERGRYVVVNFFATWCTPCVIEHEELARFAGEHASRGDAVLVSVVFDDQRSNVRDFFAQHGGDWPVIGDDTGKLALDFGVAQVPETYIIRPDGVVAAKFANRVTAAGLDQTIDQIDSGR